jgi:hypothetical protein
MLKTEDAVECIIPGLEYSQYCKVVAIAENFQEICVSYRRNGQKHMQVIKPEQVIRVK